MKTYWMRHGETQGNERGIMTGRSNKYVLTKRGEEQTIAKSKIVDKLDYDFVICSPSDRTERTCELVNTKGKEVIYDDRLLERDCGIFTGKPKTSFDFDRYWNYFDTLNVEGVMKPDELFSIVWDFIDDIKEKYPDKNILIVTHNGPCVAAEAYVKGIPEDGNLKRYFADNCQITEYDDFEKQKRKDVIKGNAPYNNVVDFTEKKESFEKRIGIEMKEQAPKVVVIGNNSHNSAIPASMFSRVGMVGKTDFDKSRLYGYNIDLSGVQQLSDETEVGIRDIPEKFLGAKHFHLTATSPEKQLELIKFLRENTTATISADTTDEFASQKECKDVFDKVDIAFMDKKHQNLWKCDASKKIVKCGEEGCLYYSKDKKFKVAGNVDKTEAGDCLAGVFLNLINNNEANEKQALKTAVKVAAEGMNKGIMNFTLPDLSDREKERGE